MEFPPRNGALEKGISGVNCVYDWKSFGSSLFCLLALAFVVVLLEINPFCMGI